MWWPGLAAVLLVVVCATVTLKALRDDPRAYTCADVFADRDKLKAVAREIADRDGASRADAEDLVIFRCGDPDIGLHDKPYAGAAFATPGRGGRQETSAR